MGEGAAVCERLDAGGFELGGVRQLGLFGCGALWQSARLTDCGFLPGGCD